MAFALTFRLSNEEASAALLSGAGAGAQLIAIDAARLSRGVAFNSFATRNAATSFTRASNDNGDVTVTRSTRDGGGLVGNVYTWAEITAFESRERGAGQASVGGAGFQIGADMAVGADALLGLSLGYSDVDASDTGFTQGGALTWVQPYFSYRAGAWSGDLSLMYAWGDFDQTTVGAPGTADLEMTSLSFVGGYDMAMTGGWTVTPTLGLTHGQVRTTGTGGTLAGTAADVDFSQFSLGSRFVRTTDTGRIFGGVYADYMTQDVSVPITTGLLASDGLSGRIEFGATRAVGNNMGLSTGLEISGIGADMRTIKGGLKISLAF